ncbi:hypothetical protein PENTCL1PPCAC_22021, partial [Pristionchus entomophagus]
RVFRVLSIFFLLRYLLLLSIDLEDILALDSRVGGGLDPGAVGGHTRVHSCLSLLCASLSPRNDSVLVPVAGGASGLDGSAGVSLARVNSLLAGAELDLLDDLSGVLLLASGQVDDGHVSLTELAGDRSLTSGGSPSGDPEISGVGQSDVVGQGKAHGLDVVSEGDGSGQLNEGDVVMGLTGVVVGVEIDSLDVDDLLGVFVALGLVEDSGLDSVVLGVEVIVDAVSCSHNPSGSDDGSSALERADLVGQPACNAPHDLPRPGVGDGDVSTNDLGVDVSQVRLDGRLTAGCGQGHGERGERDDCG